ncbi:uncharacterized protein [Coffea arabica]|uniref:Uncharacterized protein isoform X2 n=1 Tax=Coffea arabica TaxID=13443 RepID=A0ABM4W150_COFAR
MFARVSSKLHVHGRGSPFFFKSLLDYCSTPAALVAAPQTKKITPTTGSFLEECLINSLGFSKQEAISALSKLIRLNAIKKDPNLVINFLFNLGLTKTDIKKVISKSPQLLLSSVEKTLKPKISYLQTLGLSGYELVKLVVRYHRIFFRGLDNHLVPRIECLRKLLGDDEKVVLALRKIVFVPSNNAVERMEQNVAVLQNNGFSNDFIAKFVLKSPTLFIAKSEKLQEVLHRLEHDWGIPRDTNMFAQGIDVLCSGSKSKIDMKFEILRSYGWSNSEIIRMVRSLPRVLDTSHSKMRKILDYFMKEVGFSADYLASRRSVFTFSLEGRVKPRHEVLKILNDKKLSKAGLVNILSLSELQFQNRCLLPYKDILPDMYESYLKKVTYCLTSDIAT